MRRALVLVALAGCAPTNTNPFCGAAPEPAAPGTVTANYPNGTTPAIATNVSLNCELNTGVYACIGSSGVVVRLRVVAPVPDRTYLIGSDLVVQDFSSPIADAGAGSAVYFIATDTSPLGGDLTLTLAPGTTPTGRLTGRLNGRVCGGGMRELLAGEARFNNVPVTL